MTPHDELSFRTEIAVRAKHLGCKMGPKPCIGFSSQHGWKCNVKLHLGRDIINFQFSYTLHHELCTAVHGGILSGRCAWWDVVRRGFSSETSYHKGNSTHKTTRHIGFLNPGMSHHALQYAIFLHEPGDASLLKLLINTPAIFDIFSRMYQRKNKPGEGLTLETSANSISTSTLRWYIVRFTATPTQTKTSSQRD